MWGLRSHSEFRILFFGVAQTLDNNALLLWGSGDMLSEPDAKWGPTWGVKSVCLCVCDWINSPAVSLRTDHINDRTEACAHRLLIKERAEEEMEWVQTEEDYEPEKNTHLELETEDLRNKKANIRRNSAK